MNAESISTATIKKWEAIASDRLNHALVVYKSDDGLFVIDVFEVLDVRENEEGVQCLQALSLATKYNGRQPSNSTPTLNHRPKHVVEIPLTSIAASHRYLYGTGLNDLDVRRYYESIAKVSQRQHIAKMSRSKAGANWQSEIIKSTERGSGERFIPLMGCMVWLLYASALVAIVQWVF